MRPNRRRFLSNTSRVTAGFLGLRALHARGAEGEDPDFGYGDLIADTKGILSLPSGFRYQIISRAGATMDDGLLVPGAPDGMAAFEGKHGMTVVVRNHEEVPEAAGPFGENDEHVSKVGRDLLYDAAEGMTACAGGTTTIVYDTRRKRVVRQFLSLGGTIRNCAGGPTPWNSWITCEECQDLAGYYEKTSVTLAKDHGYNFDVPATTEIQLNKAMPLKEMGRFRHEAVAVAPNTGAVYQTEDQDDGVFYRFMPNKPGRLAEGGTLQTLHIVDKPSCDTRNWEQHVISQGDTVKVQWRNIDDPTAPDDDLRYRGFDAGAARFARGEGMWRGAGGEIYFAATSGGYPKRGQIWKYIPAADEGIENEQSSGTLELFLESHYAGVVENADNLTVAPWGDLIVCEDRSGDVVRLVGVTSDGHQYPFAFNHTGAEMAGVCFSPDGSTLFVNIQHRGLTLAITGPWRGKHA